MAPGPSDTLLSPPDLLGRTDNLGGARSKTRPEQGQGSQAAATPAGLVSLSCDTCGRRFRRHAGNRVPLHTEPGNMGLGVTAPVCPGSQGA